jgi:hypothetical protein
MKFNESKTTKGHLRELFAGAGGRIAGLCSGYVAPGERVFFGFRLRLAVVSGRQLQ